MKKGLRMLFGGGGTERLGVSELVGKEVSKNLRHSERSEESHNKVSGLVSKEVRKNFIATDDFTSPLEGEVCFQVEHERNLENRVRGKINKLDCFAFARNDRNLLLTYLPTNLLTCKRVAFTLAEVLITLGIIGVVAAMTLPNLIANVQDKVLETQRVKAKNILANGYKKMMSDNEVFRLSETPLASCMDTDCINSEHLKIFKTIKNGLVANDLNLSEAYIDQSGNELTLDWTNKYIFVTPDGYVYGLDIDAFLNEKLYNIYTDVNGTKNPNKEKKDLVLFTVSDTGVVSEATIENAQCSVDDLSACNEEQCLNLRGPSDYQCELRGDGQEGYFDQPSECVYIYTWDSDSNRCKGGEMIVHW